jgi:hypothetical protein
MTDPRNTDPRRQDFQFSDPVRRRDLGVDSMWGWVAGLAVVVLIAFIVIFGWNASGPETAANTPRQNAPAATTTGQGPATAPAPRAPAQSPAPNRGTQ